MNKLSKSLLVLFLALLLGSCFTVFSAQAKDDKLILDVTKKCDFQYSGDSCVAGLKITNNTGKVLDGEAVLEVNYGNEAFDGVGIEVYYREGQDKNWLKAEWDKDQEAFIANGFKIVKDETNPELKIKTHPALMPGQYSFTFTIKGGGEYIAPPVAIGGGGGGASAYSLLSADAQRVDANRDGKIDILDFNTLMVNWGSTTVGNVADFNGDGKVDIFDFNLLMVNWTI